MRYISRGQKRTNNKKNYNENEKNIFSDIATGNHAHVYRL